MAVKWWEFSGQYSTPEEVDAGNSKRVISPLRAGKWAGAFNAFSLPYLAHRTMTGGFAPRWEEWEVETWGRGQARLVRNLPGVLWSPSEVVPSPALQPSHSAPHTDLQPGSPDTFPGPDPLSMGKSLHWWGKEHCRRKIQGSLYHCLPEKWAKVLICSGYHLCFNRGSIDTISYSSQIPRILVILGLLMEGHSVLQQDVLVWANARVDFFSFVVVQLGICGTWHRQHKPVTQCSPQLGGSLGIKTPFAAHYLIDWGGNLFMKVAFTAVAGGLVC